MSEEMTHNPLSVVFPLVLDTQILENAPFSYESPMSIVNLIKTAWLVAAVILICSTHAFSASQDFFSNPGSKKVTALRIEGEIVIDGRFEEPEWSQAQLIAKLEDHEVHATQQSQPVL